LSPRTDVEVAPPLDARPRRERRTDAWGAMNDDIDDIDT
jgi:hypothetical protein